MMRWTKLWGTLLTVGVLMGIAVPAQAMMIVHQSSGALISPPTDQLREVDDRQVHYQVVPDQYATAEHLHGRNLIQSVAGAAVTFKTKYLLPIPGFNHEAWGNPQSMVTVGRYIYIVYCPTNWDNRGRIVRFDTVKLNQLKVQPAELQRIFRPGLTVTPRIQAIQAAIKIGPAFTTGHGQSLAYNWQDHQLYMWCDREIAPRIPINREGVIQRISTTTLKPVRQLRFQLTDSHLSVPGGHVLTFDKSGTAYFWTQPTAPQVYIYAGRIGADHATFRLTKQVLRRGPGTRVQSMAYNPKNDRLYLVSDDSIASLPVSGLRGAGHLTAKNVKWTGFGTRREFEALNFTSDGRAYLMSNHDPEILRSTGTNW